MIQQSFIDSSNLATFSKVHRKFPLNSWQLKPRLMPPAATKASDIIYRKPFSIQHAMDFVFLQNQFSSFVFPQKRKKNLSLFHGANSSFPLRKWVKKFHGDFFCGIRKTLTQNFSSRMFARLWPKGVEFPMNKKKTPHEFEKKLMKSASKRARSTRMRMQVECCFEKVMHRFARSFKLLRLSSAHCCLVDLFSFSCCTKK